MLKKGPDGTVFNSNYETRYSKITACCGNMKQVCATEGMLNTLNYNKQTIRSNNAGLLLDIKKNNMGCNTGLAVLLHPHCMYPLRSA